MAFGGVPNSPANRELLAIWPLWPLWEGGAELMIPTGGPHQRYLSTAAQQQPLP
jgi:hypothetical protein